MAYIVRSERKTGPRWGVYWRKRVGAKPQFLRKKDGGGYFRHEAEAMSVRERVEREIEKRPVPLVAADTAKVYEEFLSTRESDGTREFYGHHLLPFLEHQGDKLLEHYTARDLQGYIAARGGGWSDTTVGHRVAACRTFRRFAVERGYRCADFASKVKKPPASKVERRPRTPEEAERVIAYAASKGHRLLVPLALARYAGLSYGDLCILTWGEVDFDAGLIRHERHKTGYGKPIPLAAPLRAILWPRRGLKTALVCPKLRAQVRNGDHVTLRRLERAAGVVHEKGDGYHSYRHAYGTAIAKAPGVTWATVQDAMQHAPGSKETGRYIHATQDEVRDAIEHAARAGGAS